jgi:hypothetical protein
LKDSERGKCRRFHSSLEVLPGYPVNSRVTVTLTGGALSLYQACLDLVGLYTLVSAGFMYTPAYLYAP